MLPSEKAAPRYPPCDIHEPAELTRVRAMPALRQQDNLRNARNAVDNILQQTELSDNDRQRLAAARNEIGNAPSEDAIRQIINLCEALHPGLGHRMTTQIQADIGARGGAETMFRIQRDKAYETELDQAQRTTWRRLYLRWLCFLAFFAASTITVGSAIIVCAVLLPNTTTGYIAGAVILTAIAAPILYIAAKTLPPFEPKRRCYCLTSPPILGGHQKWNSTNTPPTTGRRP